MLLFDPTLSALAANLDDLEATRIAAQNRYRQLTRAIEDSDGEERGFGLPLTHPAVIKIGAVANGLLELEVMAEKALTIRLKEHLLHPWIKSMRGLGDKQAARLLAAIGDPYWNTLHERPRTVSELWAYCGYHVLAVGHRVDDDQDKIAGSSKQGRSDAHSGSAAHCGAGIAPARRRGQKSNWSEDARKRAWLIASSCVKQPSGTPYRDVYDCTRAKYVDAVHNVACVRCAPSGNPAKPGSPLSDAHKHARAMRAIAKQVLKDLWIESKRIYEEQGHAAAA